MTSEKDIVLKVENLGKLYQLGQFGTGTVSHDLNRWWAGIRGKEDPFSKVGNVNDRTQKAGKREKVWAIKDINFEVKRGEVLGIIGKNGAGKSTLLKLISNITAPTTGSIKAKGRIASLLEVGTGMHPELTGRENVFLNGTIMGMTKIEIRQKFDEIVDFAGCARYVDTPVKRYSSGMKVRLGFAVAAFLEPEILIVDEVLAVGDAEFQKKAIGKMQDVSTSEGRTVLFVSHNMGAVKTLCKSAILLDQGEIEYDGNVEGAINLYTKLDLGGGFKGHYIAEVDSPFGFTEVSSTSSEGNLSAEFSAEQDIEINLRFFTSKNIKGARIVLQLLNKDGVIVFATTDHNVNRYEWKKGLHSRKCVIYKNFLKKGIYYLKLHAGVPGEEFLIDSRVYLQFSIIDSVHGSIFLEEWPGIVAPKLKWETE